MVSHKKHVGAALGLGLVLAAARCVIVTYGMEVNAYGNDTYYLPDNFAVSAFSVASVILLAVFAIFAIGAGKGKRFELEQKSPTVSALHCTLAIMLLGAVTIYIYTAVSGSEMPTYLGMLIIVFSVGSAVVFLLNGLRTMGKTALAAMGLIPILLVIFRLLGDFLRTNATPMASSGAYHIMGLVTLMIYFLCEGKSHKNGGSAAIYLLSGYFAMILLVIYSIPNIALHCFGFFDFDYYTAYSVVDVVYAVYICARMSNAKLISKKDELAEIIRSAETASENM